MSLSSDESCKKTRKKLDEGQNICYAKCICRIQAGGMRIKMLNDEICKVRDDLNKAIEENKDYDEIYRISIKLDELIAKFYQKDVKNA